MDEIEKPASKTASRSVWEKPTVEEIQSYLSERGISEFTAEEFWSYYESVGWKVGKKPMSSWKGAVRTWSVRRERDAKFEARKIPKHDTLTGTKRTDNLPCQHCGGPYPCVCYTKFPLDYNDKNTYDEWWRALGRPNTGFGK